MKLNTKRLDELLNKRCITVFEFSKMCGLSYTTFYYAYKDNNKNLRPKTIRRIAECLNVDPVYLLEEENEENERL